MVRTGDHCEERVSRQIAPLNRLAAVCRGALEGQSTYSLGTDIGVPDLGLELHLWGAEGVLAGNPDVDKVGTAFIRCVGRASKLASKVREVIFIEQLYAYIREVVALYVGDLF